MEGGLPLQGAPPPMGKQSTQKDQISELFTFVSRPKGELVYTQAKVTFIDAHRNETTCNLYSLSAESRDAIKSLQGQINDLMMQM